MRRPSACAIFLGSAALALVAACYDEPTPTCGFRGGRDGTGPEGYTCDLDQNRCVVNGAPPDTTCPLPDAGVDAFFPPEGARSR